MNMHNAAASTNRQTVFGPNNTYKAVRIIANNYDISYTVWCSNEHELYDMKADPFQMNNLYSEVSNLETFVFGFRIDKLVSRVDALLLTLKACEGEVCTRPWETLHPKGNVRNLKDAMNPRFDNFYMERQKKVTFSECANGYLPWLEGALEPIPYKDKNGKVRRAARWEDFT